MTVVRELVTKLSFQVDKRGIENFNRSIVGFKTKFALAASAVAGFVTGVVKAVSSVADTILDTNELARSAGLATGKFIALQKAAGQFRIKPEQFNSAFSQLNQGVRDAEFGFGALFDIANQLEIEIRKDNGALKDTDDIFESIIEALGRIQDESLRIDIAKRIFGDGKFADIAKDGIKNFRNITQSFSGLGEQFEKAEQNALKFDRSLNRLVETGKELAFNVFPPLIDASAKMVEGANLIVEDFQKKGFLEAGVDLVDTVGSGFKSLFGFGDGVPEFIKREVDADNKEFNRRIDINTRIEIQPPAGSEESQKQFFVEAAKEAFTENFNNEMEKIGNNNPETE